MIFLSLRFYVKSILENLEVLKMPFLPSLGHFLANFGAKLFSHIHARGNKSGRQILDTFWQILVRTFFLIYMRVEINRAGKFGTPFSKVWCEMFFPYTCAWK